MDESKPFSRTYSIELPSFTLLPEFELKIWRYYGPEERPKWVLRGQGASCFTKRCALFSFTTWVMILDDFSMIYIVQADLYPLTGSLKAVMDESGKEVWKVVFSIEMYFGVKELKARISWDHNVCFTFVRLVQYGIF